MSQFKCPQCPFEHSGLNCEMLEVAFVTSLLVEAANRAYGLRQPDERDVDWEYAGVERQ